MRRKIAFELARVTELTAISAAPWIGKGNINSLEEVVVDVMRNTLNSLDIRGKVIIGEGEKDETPVLYSGDIVGCGNGEEVDLAVDPVQGTKLVSRGLTNALSVIAMASKGSFLNIPDIYMYKIAVGPEAKGVIDINASASENLLAVAAAKGKELRNMNVVVLDKPRHKKLIAELYKTGSRVKLISDGDVAAGISTALPDTGIDMFIGIGGAPEGVLTAAALKCLDGDIQGRLYPMNDEDYLRVEQVGIKDINKTYTINELASGDDIIFSATGITGGELLDEIVYKKDKAVTNTLLLDGLNKEVLYNNTIHNIGKNESRINQII